VSGYCWKIKALKRVGPITKGMEVEEIKKNTTGAPSGNNRMIEIIKG